MTPPPSPPREERPVVRQPTVEQVRLEIIVNGEEEIVELEAGWQKLAGFRRAQNNPSEFL